jgi:peptidoglycan/xylan/chitin deacetylase (PgdA/CDA1 family)
MNANTLIFNYHRLYSRAHTDTPARSSENFYAVALESFREHLAFLKRQNFKTLLLDEFLTQPSLEHSRNVVITFDDGNESDLTIAVPLLQEFGFRAVFFICVEYIDRAGYLTWNQVKKLIASGMSVQSHGLRHHDLTKLPHDTATNELASARQCLERNLNVKVSYLSLPGGFDNARVCSAARGAGYEAICTSLPGLARRGPKLNRFMIRHCTRQQEFEALALRKRIPILADSVRYRGARWLKQIVGVNRYEALKLRFWRQKPIASALQK